MSTPMQEQYSKLKQQYQDCILLFRLGDFYEGFDDDAKLLSKILGITLTGRGKDGSRTPMAGIPYHALNQYLPKLIKAGQKVAIAEQTEAAQPGKIVDREVVKIVTAGTVMDEKSLDMADNNYLASLFVQKSKNDWIWGVSFADLTTGEFHTGEFQTTSSEVPKELVIELFRIKPAEILLFKNPASELRTKLPDFNLQILDDSYQISIAEAERTLKELFEVASLKGFAIDTLASGNIAAAILVKYLQRTQKTKLQHFRSISLINTKNYMLLDQATIRNLELIYPLNSGGDPAKTLYGSINNCLTAMGQRRLRQWIIRPLIEKTEIQERLDCVEEILNDRDLSSSISTQLALIPDLERVLGRIGTKSANARDMLFLKSGLESAVAVCKLINNTNKKLFELYNMQPMELDELNLNVIGLIDKAIKEDPALTITEGNIFKTGYSPELDEIKLAESEGKNFVQNFQKAEIARTGITSLKVRFNRVFGYYIEVSKSNLERVPSNYIRKQTLVNAERFITSELKEWEDKILGAEERAAVLEYQLFEEVRTKILGSIEQMHKIIRTVSIIDVINNFSTQAHERGYCKPKLIENINENTVIKSGRHPVVDIFLNNEFIPNDTLFTVSERLHILTGPNMSGKSTYIRQVALIVILAQIGSFVPAKEAQIVIADRVFTRVGASDNLAGGESTFMVEMTETANILNNASERSLIILDEVGRGTSTYDGVAIAWAIVEYLAKVIKAKTLFATHYHELTVLEGVLENIKNYNVEVKESEGKILFMRKIIPGSTDRSYGIHVAQLAGVPKEVVGKANTILHELENGNTINISHTKSSKISLDQMSFSEVTEDQELRNMISEVDINQLTPLEALNKLKEIQQQLK